jgi:hypothetical protein
VFDRDRRGLRVAYADHPSAAEPEIALNPRTEKSRLAAGGFRFAGKQKPPGATWNASSGDSIVGSGAEPLGSDDPLVANRSCGPTTF